MRKILISMLFNAFFGGVMASLLGFAPFLGAVAVNVLALAVGNFMPQGAAFAGVFTEVWTGEMVKRLRKSTEGSWLDGIPDYSKYAKNNVIHLADATASPQVLINNKNYPMDVTDIPDLDVSISLTKFQTKPTPITDDELYSLSYDKIKSVVERHGDMLNVYRLYFAAHSLCPAKHTQSTPVLQTTGEMNATTKLSAITLKDVLAMKNAMDEFGVPMEGRRLVLSTAHVNDLLATEQTFREQYGINRQDGTIARLYGFDCYESAYNPAYFATGAKAPVTQAATAVGASYCSFAFLADRVFKCTGETTMYYSEAKTDPLNQRNLVNFRNYFTCMPKKQDAMVAMVSKYTA